MSLIVQLIASAVEPGAFVERKLQRAEWIEVDGSEVVLRGVGGWAHGVLSRHPVGEVLARWAFVRGDT